MSIQALQNLIHKRDKTLLSDLLNITLAKLTTATHMSITTKHATGNRGRRRNVVYTTCQLNYAVH
jgi:hypothetical protein